MSQERAKTYPLVEKFISAKKRKVKGLGTVITLADLEAALQFGTVKRGFCEMLQLNDLRDIKAQLNQKESK